jgi:hypothetical protein
MERSCFESYSWWLKFRRRNCLLCTSSHQTVITHRLQSLWLGLKFSALISLSLGESLFWRKQSTTFLEERIVFSRSGANLKGLTTAAGPAAVHKRRRSENLKIFWIGIIQPDLSCFYPVTAFKPVNRNAGNILRRLVWLSKIFFHFSQLISL